MNHLNITDGWLDLWRPLHVSRSRVKNALQRFQFVSVLALATSLTGCFGPIPPSSAGIHEAEYLLVVDTWQEKPESSLPKLFQVSQAGRSRLEGTTEVILEAPENCGDLNIAEFNCMSWVEAFKDQLKVQGIAVTDSAQQTIEVASSSESAKASENLESASTPSALPDGESADTGADGSKEETDSDQVEDSKNPEGDDSTAKIDSASSTGAASDDSTTEDAEPPAPIALKLSMNVSSESIVPLSRKYFFSDDQGHELDEKSITSDLKTSLNRRVDEIRAGRQWRKADERKSEYLSIELVAASSDLVLATYSSGFLPLTAPQSPQELRVLFGLKKIGLKASEVKHIPEDWIVVTPQEWRLSKKENVEQKPEVKEAPKVKEDGSKMPKAPASLEDKKAVVLFADKAKETISMLFSQKAKTP